MLQEGRGDSGWWRVEFHLDRVASGGWAFASQVELATPVLNRNRFGFLLLKGSCRLSLLPYFLSTREPLVRKCRLTAELLLLDQPHSRKSLFQPQRPGTAHRLGLEELQPLKLTLDVLSHPKRLTLCGTNQNDEQMARIRDEVRDAGGTSKLGS